LSQRVEAQELISSVEVARKSRLITQSYHGVTDPRRVLLIRVFKATLASPMSENDELTTEQKEEIYKQTCKALYLQSLLQQYAEPEPDSVAGLAAGLKSWQEDRSNAPLPEELAGFGEQLEQQAKQHRKERAEGFEKLWTQALASNDHRLLQRITDASKALATGQKIPVALDMTGAAIFAIAELREELGHYPSSNQIRERVELWWKEGGNNPRVSDQNWARVMEKIEASFRSENTQKVKRQATGR
jgi:hypothetical protein